MLSALLTDPVPKLSTPRASKSPLGGIEVAPLTSIAAIAAPVPASAKPMRADAVTKATDPVVTVTEGPNVDRLVKDWLVVDWLDRKSTRLNSSHVKSSYAVF